MLLFCILRLMHARYDSNLIHKARFYPLRFHAVQVQLQSMATFLALQGNGTDLGVLVNG